MRDPVEVYVGVGSNLGDRDGTILAAADALRRVDAIGDVEVSPLYETAPVGDPLQPPYRNGVVRLRTTLGPRALLDRLLAIEASLGRRRVRRWGPRTIDLDLLLHGDRILDEPDLVVPHPRMAARAFVLRPLCDLDPMRIHPVLGRTVRALLGEVTRQEEVGRREEVGRQEQAVRREKVVRREAIGRRRAPAPLAGSAGRSRGTRGRP